MDLKIIKERPPMWEKIKEVFDIDESKTLFSYGDAIYNPAGLYIDDHLYAHEKTHTVQQEEMGGPEEWWKLYIESSRLRLQWEVEAYAVQYRSYCNENKDRNKRARYLHTMACFLSSPTYQIDISTMDAMKLILDKSRE